MINYFMNFGKEYLGSVMASVRVMLKYPLASVLCIGIAAVLMYLYFRWVFKN